MNPEKKHHNPVAHILVNSDGLQKEHDLYDHLLSVSMLASSFAEEFGNADWTATAGMLHDLGKYNPAWQKYIRKSNGDYLEDIDGQD